ncbi:MAG: hypothetical protein DMD86_19630 [Candidatus Rokuibacteriota bacterium]|nr:MAG: hypothetical protein DMD86_19630 [Candidatus Rokubacteria bacterium]
MRSAPDCAFCRVVRGEGPRHVVFEDDISLGFLDHRPLFRGHCLLVPRTHVVVLADLACRAGGRTVSAASSGRASATRATRRWRASRSCCVTPSPRSGAAPDRMQIVDALE